MATTVGAFQNTGQNLGPASSQGYGTAATFPSGTEALVVIGAFAVGIMALFAWHGIGVKIDGGASVGR
jgi:hypothetical protein